MRQHFLSMHVRAMHVHATVGVMVRSGRYIVAQTPRSVTEQNDLVQPVNGEQWIMAGITR